MNKYGHGTRGTPPDPNSQATQRLMERAAEGKYPLTERRALVFLAHLRQHGIVSQAAYAASPHSESKTPPTQAFYNQRRVDPDFAASWDDAVAHADGLVEMEIHRRGVEGFEEPVFFKGVQTDKIRRYSDPLLIAKAKANIPKYRDKQTVTHEGGMALDMNLESLSPESRADLRRILEREAAKQSESSEPQ